MMEYLKLADHESFVNEAFIEAKKSPCKKQKVGAIIVRDNKILSRGYNVAVGNKSCEKCLREQFDLHHGENAEMCYAVHAEQNAILNALNQGIDISDAYMYIAAIKNNKKRIHTKPYCTMCSRIIATTKLKGVIDYMGDKLICYTPTELNDLAFENNIVIRKEKKDIKK